MQINSYCDGHNADVNVRKHSGCIFINVYMRAIGGQVCKNTPLAVVAVVSTISLFLPVEGKMQLVMLWETTKP